MLLVHSPLQFAYYTVAAKYTAQATSGEAAREKRNMNVGKGNTRGSTGRKDRSSTEHQSLIVHLIAAMAVSESQKAKQWLLG
jgi:hypothetical protein